MMRYFLDMNFPIYFCMQIGNPLEEKAKKFVNFKGNNIFLLCDYIKTINLPKWIKRQKIILFEFNQKIINPDYPLFSSEQSTALFPQDKQFAKKLFSKYIASKNKEIFRIRINQIFNFLPEKINQFMKIYVDEIVIPEYEINFELKSCLFTWLAPNDSDAKTLASAIQEHNNKELIIITSDRKHWKKEILEEVHFNINLKKKYPKLPDITYLQDA